MANAVAARLKGDEYQHLFAWLHALELLMPQRQVSKVIVEDEKALSADAGDVKPIPTQPAGFPGLSAVTPGEHRMKAREEQQAVVR